MNADRAATVPTPPDHPAPAPAPGPAPGPARRRLHPAALLNTAGLLATTALPVVSEPKLPRYVGDEIRRARRGEVAQRRLA
jgi:hypothetical protein